MNLLQILRAAAGRIGLSPPSAGIGSSDLQVIQLVELANEEGQELSARHSWQALTRETTFETVAQESQGSLATIIGENDDLGWIINDTLWNRDSAMPIFGPRAPKDWQQEKAFSITGPYPQFRIRGDEILFLPAPPSGQTIAFEYVSKRWIRNSDGDAYYEMFDDDSDIPLLDSQLILKGLVWRWKKAKGLAYAEDFNAYERQVADVMGRDGMKRSVSLSGRKTNVMPGIWVSAGSWNQ